MLNPEAVVIQAGTAVLVALALVRIAIHEFNSLVDDVRRKRKHR
jgi:hypothetical protein